MAYTNFTGPVQADFGFQTASYTVADLPAVEDNIFLIASDANGGTGTVVFGKNGQWIDARTDQPVSTNPPTPIPFVSSVSPNTGSTAGGTNITINGFNFTGVTAVSIGGTPVTSFALVSDIEITAVTAARAAGNVYVNVTNAYGTSTDTAGAAYTYQVPVVVPVITSTTVPGGWVGGGSSNFIINGTGFTSTLDVIFNGNSATFVELSDTQILITNFPGGLTGTANIVVFTSSSSSAPYTGWSYLTNGVITSISPNSGTASGGTNITVSGYGFNTTNDLQFEIPGSGSASATGLSVVSDNEINAITPNFSGSSGSANARVFNPSYSAGPYTNGVFTFTAVGSVPTISSVNVPGAYAYGAASTDIYVSGAHFNGTTSVTIQGIPVTYNVNNDGEIYISAIPSGGSLGNAPIVITNAAGSSSPFTSFTFVNVPVFTQLVPNSGSNAGGAVLDVYGYGFTGTNIVQLLPSGGVISSTTPTVYNDSYMSFTLPANGGTGATDVRGSNILTLTSPWYSGLFTYTAAPVLPVISGTTVNGGYVGGGDCYWAIAGSGFTGATSVTFQGNPATFSVIDDTAIRVLNLPAGSAGNGDIVVTTPAGSSSTYTVWQYVTTGRVANIVPSSGPNSGGTGLTVYGYGFNNSTQAQFSIPGASNFTAFISVVNDNEFTVTSPSTTPFSGLADVRIYNPSFGFGAFTTGAFTFTAAPVITSVNGAPSGTGQSGAYAYGIPSNASIFVVGSGFTGATNVYIQGSPCTFTVIDDSNLVIDSTPSLSVGSKSIQVETAVGLSNAYTDFIFTDVPVITQLVPTSGPTTGGTSVGVYGYAFTTMNAFQFYGTNNVSVTPSVVADSYATLTTSAYATAEAVQVRGANPIGGAGAFVSGLWTFTAPIPTITSTSVAGGSVLGGFTNIEIYGTNLSGATSVTFQGNAATFNDFGTYLQVTMMPAGTLGSGNIVVTTPYGSSATYTAWNYVNAPVITSIVPSVGPVAGGTLVDLYGYGFQCGRELIDYVQFAGTTTSYSVYNSISDDTTCSTITDPHATAEPTNVAAGSNVTGGYGPALPGGFTYV